MLSNQCCSKKIQGIECQQKLTTQLAKQIFFARGKKKLLLLVRETSDLHQMVPKRIQERKWQKKLTKKLRIKLAKKNGVGKKTGAAC